MADTGDPLHGGTCASVPVVLSEMEPESLRITSPLAQDIVAFMWWKSSTTDVPDVNDLAHTFKSTLSNKPYILSILSYMHVIYENIHKRVFCFIAVRMLR